MEEEFNILKSALTAFMEDMWIPFEDSLGIINHEFSSEKKENLKTEFIEATVNQDFDWLRLAKDTLLLIEPEFYSNLEIKNYVKFLLQDYLFPEKTLIEQDIEHLNIAVENILREYQLNEGWMYSYYLFDELKSQDCFKELEYYNLWKIPYFIHYKYYIGEVLMFGKNYLNKSNKRNDNVCIERKPIESKEKEIGFLRFVQNL